VARGAHAVRAEGDQYGYRPIRSPPSNGRLGGADPSPRRDEGRLPAQALDERMSGSIIRAAGGVVWRRAESGLEGSVEVALVHRPRYDDWSLPKGKLGPGEPEVVGAVREVLEETGYHVRVGQFLGETRYDKLTRKGARPKVVRWWAMEATSGAFTPTSEVDEIQWSPLAEAEKLLNRDTDRDLLRRFWAWLTPTDRLLSGEPGGARPRDPAAGS